MVELRVANPKPALQLYGATLMDTGREIRCYDYVNHPYERVRDVLKENAVAVFQSATKTAAARAESVAAELHVDFGGLGVKSDIKISVKGIEEALAMPGQRPRHNCFWNGEAATAPPFPLMKGSSPYIHSPRRKRN